MEAQEFVQRLADALERDLAWHPCAGAGCRKLVAGNKKRCHRCYQEYRKVLSLNAPSRAKKPAQKVRGLAA